LSTLTCNTLLTSHVNPTSKLFFVLKEDNTKVAMGKDLLNLSASTIERLAMVRLDERIAGYSWRGHPKTYVFWTLRALGHRGVSLAAFDARHSVLRPTLQNVAGFGDAGWCHVMLEGGADVEAADQDGYRALHNAARLGHLDVLAVLLEHGADVDPMVGRETALDLAVLEGHAAVIALLSPSDA
jgi:hypothetical protein